MVAKGKKKWYNLKRVHTIKAKDDKNAKTT